MKTANSTITTGLAQSHSMQAQPKLIAEWNLNRYYNVIADNIPSDDSDGFDIEMFPIESIYLPNRPTKGICKARVNEGKIYAGYSNPRTARFYVADYDDIYKYWTSPYPSDPATGALTNCQPFITYGTEDSTGLITYTNVTANKIVVKFENSWATPANFQIEARISGSWTVVFTQANITDATWERTGELVLYYNGTNWRQNNPAAPTTLRTNLTGLRLTVTSLKGGVQEDGSTTFYTTATAPTTPVLTTGKDSHLNLIEISARRETNLTADLVTVDDDFNIGEASNLYPIGTLTGNSGSVVLWNGDNTYSADSPDSPYIDLLEPNAELRLQYIYTVGGVAQPAIDQFTLYADSWASQKSDLVTVELTDYSKYFQNIKPRPAMWENLTVPEILFRVCDSIGFSKYQIDQHDATTNFVIPVFWTDGEQNMWEVLDGLAKASQSAIYFDGRGVLRIKTREAAFDDTKSPDYALRAVPSGTTLSNIISADQTTEYEANSVKVTYQNTRWSDYNNGQPAMQKVWEPDDTVTLRSSPLIRPLLTTDTWLTLSAADATIWPYSGMVNIDGEVIRYEGKHYWYYTYVGSVGTRNFVVLQSADDLAKYNAMTPLAYQYRNGFTGSLQIATTEDGSRARGVWNTGTRAHPIDANGYSVKRIIKGVYQFTRAGFAHLASTSKVQLMTNFGYTSENDFMLATQGAPYDDPFWLYGTKFRFVTTSGLNSQTAGLVIHNDGTYQEGGYYIELTNSARMTADARKTRNELMLYTRTGGKTKAIGMGAAVAVAENIDYEIDVAVKVVGAVHQIKVWVNGKLCISASLTGTDRRASNGRFGMMARGRTHAQFEYLYALRRPEAVDPPDDFSFLDKKTGGFIGSRWEAEWVFGTATGTRIVKKKSAKVLYRKNEKFFDEFGPYVHEIREFDVKFDPKPILHSRPYSTNDWMASVLEYQGTPFGAKFILCNVARENAVVNGEDSITFAGSGSTVNQVLTVFGRPLVLDEAESKEAKHLLQIQKRGPIEVELTSPWIQSEQMATALSEWILKNMAYGNEELSVEIYGNPLIEITDVVQVFYPSRDLNGQNYFVTGIKNTFDEGLTTSVTLRRVNPAVV
jgi:hypothetical protein